MKRRRNSRREIKRLARETRRSYVSMALGVLLFALIAVPALLNVPTVSPVTLVQAQVVRGEKIDAASVPPYSGAPTNAQAVLSNSIAAIAPTNSPSNAGQLMSNSFVDGDIRVTVRRVFPPADANSLPEIIKQDGKEYLNLTFASLASFPFKVTPEVADANASDDPDIAARRTRAQVPDSVRAFNEKSAAVTGFMLPVRVTDGLTSDFLLLRNQSACCYGKMPRVNEWVIVRMAGKGVKPVMDVPITALGTFHVGEIREDGHLVGIYQLDCDQLLPAK